MKNTPLIATLFMTFVFASTALAHEGEHFSAGAPAKPKNAMRTVTVTMHEGSGTMSYEPNTLTLKRGEEVHFVIKNEGALTHEFMLATVTENAKHGKLMEKYPDMEHDDPNGKTVEPGKTADIYWKFTKRGTFEFACLIPGHHQAGMHGSITVK